MKKRITRITKTEIMRITQNKKGFLANAFVLLICFIAFCIVGLIFYIMFSFVNRLSVYDIKSQQTSVESDYLLLSYLRSPIDIGGDRMSIADLMSLYYHNPDYKDPDYKAILIKETKTILNSFQKPDNSGWNIGIYLMPEDEELIGITTYEVVGWYEKRKAIGYLPLTDAQGKWLKIKLHLECQGRCD